MNQNSGNESEPLEPLEPPAPINVPPPMEQMLNYATPGLLAVRPIRDRARRAIVSIWIWVTMAILGGVLGLIFLVITDFGNREVAGTEDFPGGVGMLVALAAFGMGYGVASVVAIVMYLMWQFRAHHNAMAISSQRLRFSPGWGVGYWFIPILNFFRPYQVVREIDAASPTTDGMDQLGPMIGRWWMVWILSFVVDLVGTVVVEVTEDDVARSIDVVRELIALLLVITAAAMTVRIVRQISDRQATVSG